MLSPDLRFDLVKFVRGRRFDLSRSVGAAGASGQVWGSCYKNSFLGYATTVN
jgi:hypothetical protein